MKRLMLALVTSTVMAATARAADNIDQINALTQTEFRQLSEDLGSALSYKAVQPAASLGVLGFDIGADFTTKGAELVLSKGFATFTPYVGVGRVWTHSAPVGVTNVVKEEFGQNKYFVGGNINLIVLNIALEADRTGNATSYGLKLGWRF